MTWPATTIMHRQVHIHMGDVGQESQHEFGSEHVYQHVCVVHIGAHIQMYKRQFTQFTLEKQY